MKIWQRAIRERKVSEGGGALRLLTEILIMVICAQVLMVLVGQESFAKYLRMFVGLLVLWKFTIAFGVVISGFEEFLYRIFPQ